MQTKYIEKYFFVGLLVATLVFVFFIFRPFWIVLILGISFSTVLYPMYLWFRKYKCPDWLSSLLTLVIFTAIICGPLLGIGLIVLNQSQNAYHTFVAGNNSEPFLLSLNQTINNYLPPMIHLDMNLAISKVVAYVTTNFANIFTTTVSAMFSFVLMILIMFNLLKDGEKLKKAAVIFSPLNDEEDEQIISKFAVAINAVVKGYLFIALIQGVLMWLGLWFFHVPNPALWGMVAAICSMIPTFGTAFISVPAIIFLVLRGDSISAAGLATWALLAVGMVDNFLSPFIVGKKIQIPSIAILFSVVGGIALLGPVGVILGPLAVSMLYTLISIYQNESAKN